MSKLDSHQLVPARLLNRQTILIAAALKLESLLPSLAVRVIRETVPTLSIEYYNCLEIYEPRFIFGGRTIAKVDVKDDGTFWVQFVDPISEISEAVLSLSD